MPREQINIESFDAGIITTVDAQDTPINAASWSVDQDPEAPQGVLRGREGDDAYIDENHNHSGSTFGWIIREDGKRDFIFYSKTTGNFCSIVDFYGTKAWALQVGLTTEMQTSIESVNRSVRFASGNNAVKYLGYIDHAQFGGSAPSGLQYVDSKLSAPIMIPRYHKVAYVSGTYGYGIEYEGQYIYKVTMATGVFSIGTTRFQKIKSICHNGTNLYIFDEGASTYGTLYLIDITTLGITASYPLKGWGSDGTVLSGCSVCDIELSNGNTNIYFAVRRTDGTVKYDGSTAEQGNCWIWKYATASLSNNVSFSTTIYSFLLTPTLTPTRGVFNDNLLAGATFFTVPKRPFVKLTNTLQANQIGMLLNISADVWKDNTSAYGAPHLSIWLFHTSFATNDIMLSTNSNIIELRTSSSTDFTTLPDHAVWLTGSTAVSSQWYDVMVLSIGGVLWTYSSQYDIVPGTHTLFSATSQASPDASTYDADTRFGGSGWIPFDAIDGDATITDSIVEMSLAIRSWASSTYTWYVFAIGTTDHPRSLYNASNDQGIIGSTVYIKRSPLYATFASVAYLATSVPFSTAKRYFYRFSLTYQDSQESPLFQTVLPYSIVPSNNDYAILITGKIASSELNSRVTAINVYRAEAESNGISIVLPVSSYRLTGTIELRDAMVEDGSTTFPASKQFLFYDIGTYGPSYEAQSGIPESLPNNYIRYSISTQGNGYIFAGQCFNEEFETNAIANIIFRSKRNAPDTFDWSNDFLVLPFRPLALHFFRNQLFAFDQNTVLVIDPESFQLIAKLDGYGVVEPSNVTSNNEFMVFANANNIYLHDGQNIQIISRAINISQYSTVGSLTVSTHRGLMSSYTLSIAFFSKKNSIAFCYIKINTTPKIFLFHIPTKSFHYWEVQKTAVYLTTQGNDKKVLFSDYLGNIYLSTAYGIVLIGTGTTVVTKTLTGWSSGTVTLVINGTSYSQTASGTSAQTITAWAIQHTATLAALGIIVTNPSASNLTFTPYGITAFVVNDGSAGDGSWTSATNGIAEARKTCYWISRQFNGGNATRIKKFIRIILNGTLATKTYALDSSTTISTAFTSGSNLSDSTTNANSIWLKLTVTATEQLNAITIIFRRMMGLR